LIDKSRKFSSGEPPMRCILLILDGLGDHGHAAFGGQTPLQMADTPNLDRLAALGMTASTTPGFWAPRFPARWPTSCCLVMT
jgi:hypothetical protein